MPPAIIHAWDRDEHYCESWDRARRRDRHGRVRPLQPRRTSQMGVGFADLRHQRPSGRLQRRQSTPRDTVHSHGRGCAGIGLRSDLHQASDTVRPRRCLASGVFDRQSGFPRSVSLRGCFLDHRPVACPARPGAVFYRSRADRSHDLTLADSLDLGGHLRGQRAVYGNPQRPPALPAPRPCPDFLLAGVDRRRVLVNTILASGMPEGSLSGITIAFAVMMMPQVIIAQATGIAVLPTFSAQVARNALSEMRASLANTLRGVLFLSLPASVGLIILRRPVVAMLFQRGAFDARSTELVAWASLGADDGFVFPS